MIHPIHHIIIITSLQ